MGETRGVCFDPAPLLAQLRTGAGTRETAKRLDVSRETVRLWRLGGRRMQARTADVVALRLGLHPSTLWPDWDTAQERCPKGHPWADNERPIQRGRTCRTCVRDWKRAYRARVKATDD